MQLKLTSVSLVSMAVCCASLSIALSGCVVISGAPDGAISASHGASPASSDYQKGVFASAGIAPWRIETGEYDASHGAEIVVLGRYGRGVMLSAGGCILRELHYSAKEPMLSGSFIGDSLGIVNNTEWPGFPLSYGDSEGGTLWSSATGTKMLPVLISGVPEFIIATAWDGFYVLDQEGSLSRRIETALMPGGVLLDFDLLPHGCQGNDYSIVLLSHDSLANTASVAIMTPVGKTTGLFQLPHEYTSHIRALASGRGVSLLCWGGNRIYMFADGKEVWRQKVPRSNAWEALAVDFDGTGEPYTCIMMHLMSEYSYSVLCVLGPHGKIRYSERVGKNLGLGKLRVESGQAETLLYGDGTDICVLKKTHRMDSRTDHSTSLQHDSPP